MEKSRLKELLAGFLTVVIVIAFAIVKGQFGEDGTDKAVQSDSRVETEADLDVDLDSDSNNSSPVTLTFRNEKLLKQHYEKHGVEMGFSSAGEYEAAAGAVVNNPAALHKLEAEDHDDVYFVEATNEFVIVSTDGYIRTYYIARDGIDYFNRQ